MGKSTALQPQQKQHGRHFGDMGFYSQVVVDVYHITSLDELTGYWKVYSRGQLIGILMS